MKIGQFFHTKWAAAMVASILILAVAACSPFGGQKQDQPIPTQTPPPTETPLSALPTYTPTPTQVVEEPTPTPSSAEEKPTLTPTPESQQKPAQPDVGGGEPAVAPVTYKVTVAPQMGNVIQKGSFEQGFDNEGIGNDWSTFDNGHAVYAWEEDLQPIHVSHGQHAQLMRIMGPGESDRFVGIYQTVDVIAGETYTLSLHGVIQSSTAGRHQTPYGHRLQWAVDHEGRGDWLALDPWAGWTDTGWNDVKLEEEHPQMNAYTAQITPEGAKITLFIRGWTKWPIINSEAKYYVDGIFLEGPVPGGEETITVSTGAGGAEEGMPTTGGTATWIPIVGVFLVLGFALWEVRKAWMR